MKTYTNRAAAAGDVTETIAPASTTKKTKSRASSRPSAESPDEPAQPSDSPQSGVRDPRPPARPSQALADPRRAASRDLIAVQRRFLWKPRENDESPWISAEIGGKSARDAEEAFRTLIDKGDSSDDELPTVAPLPQEDVTASVKNARSADQAAQVTMLHYRYTKGLETVNDELGYGERIMESFCVVQRGELVPWVRTSQRTKSGRQHLLPLPDESEAQFTKPGTQSRTAAS